jgi:iron complex outermembrane receptor protein
MRKSHKSELQCFLLAGSSLLAVLGAANGAYAQDGSKSSETVIVTGTRVSGMTAADSAAPITVLGSDALTHGTGSPDLRQALGSAVPSFTAQQFGGSFSNLTLSAALRGLSPNDTLILVNGHRRHYSGVLHFYAGGFDSGSSSPDLSLIPQAAIDHVEVLLDGAAAQYGTDAIAGVVNIILKHNSSGGLLSASSGQYYSNEGQTYDLSYNGGLPLFDKGYVNFTLNKQFTGYTQNGGADSRYINAQGQPVPQNTVTGVGANGVATLSATGNGIPNSLLPYVEGYPRANKIAGNPEVQLTVATVNAAYDFTDHFQVYAFGSIAHKFAKSYQTYRLGDQIIATAGSNQPCSSTNLNGYNTAVTSNGITPACAVGVGGGVAPLGNNGLNASGQVISSGNAGNLFSGTLIQAGTGAALPSATGQAILGSQPELVMYPGGFQPYEGMKEDDYQYNVGTKFQVGSWNVDANIGYGKDIDLIYTLNSGNRSLFIDTHTTPTNLYDGSFTASQFTGTLDASRTFDVGMASPLTVAIGAEAREDLYGLGAGDAASYYKEGAQSRPGFLPVVAGLHSRKNYAGYIDLAVAPIPELQIDVAGRAEHYTDFGDTQIGRITVRYDITPQIAVRGTVSTGFRAPTLAEEFYTNTSVSPTSASIQLPADSAAAKVLGLPNLGPETSTNYSAGLVAHPFDDLTVTLDAYSISLANRITSSSTITRTGGSINAPQLVSSAIALMGITLDPTATQQGVTAFLNALSTHTEGVDLTANYLSDIGDYGLVNWTLAGNYNHTSLSKAASVPAVLLAANPNATFFTYQTRYNFTHSIPTFKIGLTANWSLDEFGVTARETFYGPQHNYVSPNNGGELIPANQAGVGLTDIELRYNITEQLQFGLGGNNIFDIRPDATGFTPSNCSGGGIIVTPGGSCAVGPNKANGQAFPANNSSLIGDPRGTSFSPNGGYYYARVTFNF